MKSISVELSDFIINVYKFDLNIELNGNTKVFSDMILTGDDAFDFFVQLCRHFSLDCSGFEFSKRFASEGMNLFYGNENKKDMTLEEIDACIVEGVLR